MSINRVKIGWNENDTQLHFTFPEVLSKKAAIQAIAEWSSCMQRSYGETILVWDCTTMRDYEPMARILWQQALKEHKEKVEKIYLISDSKVIRLAANLMSLFGSTTIIPLKSTEEISLQAAA